LQAVSCLLLCVFGLFFSAKAQISDSSNQSDEELIIAVASNFRLPLEQVVAKSPYWSSQNLKLVTGSTGTLYAQIINGAPFDIFLSADRLRPTDLVSKKFADASLAYATGRIALWPVPTEIMMNRMATSAKIQRLLTQHEGKFAIAHPDLAPYGKAAQAYIAQFATNTDILNNLVLASNVTQAFQSIDSGNASLGIVAESLLIQASRQFNDEKYKRYLVLDFSQKSGVVSGVNNPQSIDKMTEQHAVVLISSKQKERANAFIEFLLSDSVQKDLSTLGYISKGEADYTDLNSGSAEQSNPIKDSDFAINTNSSTNSFLSNWQAIGLTLKLAALTVIILLIIGLPFAWWLARYQGFLKPFIEALVALPLVLPPTVLGFYLLSAFSPNTFMGGLWISMAGDQFVFSFAGILVGSIIYSLPFVIQPLLVAFTQLANSALLSASTLGISPFKRFMYVILPMAKNSLITAVTLGFAHTLGEFGLVLMIGGNIPGETQVVSIALFNQVESLQYAQAHQLALILLVASLLSLSLLYKFNRQTRPLGIGA
jgi:molybdate transport system permease protein